MSLATLLCPPPVRIAAQQARENIDFNGTVTFFEEVGDEEESRVAPVAGLRNLTGARCYPINSTDRVSGFEYNPDYTDKILMSGYFPRLNSSMTATFTDPTGEQRDFNVKAVAHDGNPMRTTALCQATFDRR